MLSCLSLFFPPRARALTLVPFGMVVRCPTCMIAAAVAQPQHSIQIVSCSKCRCQFELVSGNILTIESEETWISSYRTRLGCSCMEMRATVLADTKAKHSRLPAAVHSIVVETPSWLARTHMFATETVDLPTQEGERVTIALAAPSSVTQEFGLLKLSSRVPKFYPEEPMCLKNRRDGRESRLLSAPQKDSVPSIFNPSILFPVLAVLATGDAASGIIDPSLPQLILLPAISSLAIGATFSGLFLPQLNKLS